MRTATTNKTGDRTRCEGFTLIEIVIALATVTMISAGLIALTLQTRRIAEHNRVATEARALGKCRMEDMVAMGRDKPDNPTCELLQELVRDSSLGHEMRVTPFVEYHAADGTVVPAADADYCEIRVDVHFDSPLFPGQGNDSYALILED